MKKQLILIILCTCLTCVSFSQTNQPGNPAAAPGLEGSWIIDLRPTPESEPYLQELTIHFTDATRFSGSFYESAFTNGETNSQWGSTWFAFVTEDRRSTYFSSGYLENDQLKGVTYCDNRDFVMPWTGIRKKEITK